MVLKSSLTAVGDSRSIRPEEKGKLSYGSPTALVGIRRREARLLSEEYLQRFRVDIVCKNQEVNKESPAGKFLFPVQGVVSELEPDFIGERPKDGLARARLQCKRLGRPSARPVTAAEIVLARDSGRGWRSIEDEYRVPVTSARRYYQNALRKRGGMGGMKPAGRRRSNPDTK